MVLSAESSPNMHEGIKILQHVYNTYQDIFDDIHIINDQCNSFPMYQNVLTEVNLQTAHHEWIDSFFNKLLALIYHLSFLSSHYE